MLEKIRIKNFQCHDKLEVDLDPHVTTFVGSSDRGKSAIVRALRWLCLNHPQGDQFIKEGAKGTTVQVIVDGKAVTRKRGKGLNSYHLQDQDFKAFGLAIPHSILGVLSVDDINFQSQFDAPFWFCLSAPEVSRQINQIVDLGVIDESLTNISKVVRDCQQEKQRVEKNLDESRKLVEELSWSVDADIDLRDVERLDDERTRETASAASLSQTVERIISLTERSETARQQFTELADVLSFADSAREANQHVREIIRIIDQCTSLQTIIDIGVPDCSEIDDAVVLYDECRLHVERLSSMLKRINDSVESLQRAKIELNKSEYRLQSETEGVCPICGGTR